MMLVTLKIVLLPGFQRAGIHGISWTINIKNEKN
jgi:hypothetical protein